MASIIDLEKLSDDNLKKRVLGLISTDDWIDECTQCGRPSLLHKPGLCTRSEKEDDAVILKIWKDFRSRMKNIIVAVKAEINKDKEDNILLEGLKRLAEEQSLTMTKLVDSLKTKETKESKEVVSEVRTAWVTKPAKVPSAGQRISHWRLTLNK